MAEAHLSPEQLEQYVLGALPPVAAAALEAHASACDACAERLAQEARLELALTEVARAPIPLAARRRRLLLPAVVLGALAAAALLVLLPRTPPPAPSPPAPQAVVAEVGVHRVVCVEAGLGRGCVAAAHQQGLLLQDPALPQDVPLYEEGTQVPREALTAQRPFSL